jgi:hypothetical protein
MSIKISYHWDEKHDLWRWYDHQNAARRGTCRTLEDAMDAARGVLRLPERRPDVQIETNRIARKP